MKSIEVTTVVTEGYTEVTEALKEEELVDEITTERQNIPLRTTSKRFETTRKVNRDNFFRRNNPRRFKFGQKSSLTASATKLKPTVT